MKEAPVSGRILTRRLRGVIAALAISILGLPGFTVNANAEVLPEVRVISPSFDPKNDTFAGDKLAQWYAVGGRSFYKYVGAGSTITITYLVTSDGTTPLVDKTINFMVNAPYSLSKATWEVDGKAVGPSKDAANGYGLLLTGKTNAEGKISFTVKNTDSASIAEPLPASENQPRPENGRLHGNMKAVIDGLTDLKQIIDLVTFDITKAPAVVLSGATPTPTPSATATATPTPTPTTTNTPVATKATPSIRLISPTYSASNSVETTKEIAQWYTASTKAWYTYLAAGSSVALKYKVTKDGTTPWAGIEVTLQVNAPYSGSKVKWTSGSTKIGAPTAENAAGGELKATTNAAGEVTFNLTNADTSGLEPSPATPNAALPATRLYSTLKPVIAGYGDKDADIDLITFDIYTAPKTVAKKTTITCVKGKTTKKVTAVNPKCPSGYKKK